MKTIHTKITKLQKRINHVQKRLRDNQPVEVYVKRKNLLNILRKKIFFFKNYLYLYKKL